MSVTQQRMAAIFNEWMRRATADSESFDWIGPDNFAGEDYGEHCAKYFTELAAEMDAQGLLPRVDAMPADIGGQARNTQNEEWPVYRRKP
jgi:hypothetical protein